MTTSDQMLIQGSEPFLASLYNDSDAISDGSFIKPRNIPSGFYPPYQSVYVAHAPPGYAMIGPTPSPSPYSEQENDPLYRVRMQNLDGTKHPVQQADSTDYSRATLNNLHQLNPYLEHSIVKSKPTSELDKIMVNDSFSLDANAHFLDDPGVSPVEYPQRSQDITLSQALISHYRSNGDYYHVDSNGPLPEDVAGQSGVYNTLVGPSDMGYSQVDALYPPQYLNMMAQTGAETGKKSPHEMYSYIPTWNTFHAPHPQPNQLQVIPQIMNAQSLVDHDFAIDEQDKLSGANTLQIAFASSTSKPFPLNEQPEPEAEVPRLRGRKNSSFKEYQSSSTAPSTLPPNISREIEQEFLQSPMTSGGDEDNGMIDVVNDDASERSLTTLTTSKTPKQPAGKGSPAKPSDYSVTMDDANEAKTINKMRSVFMSFVEQSSSNSGSAMTGCSVTPEEDVEKNKLLVDMCKSLILDSGSAGNQDAIVVNQHQIEAAVMGHDPYATSGQALPQPPGKRYSLRNTEGKVTSGRITRTRSLKKQQQQQQQAALGYYKTSRAPKSPCTTTMAAVEAARATGNKCTYCGKTFPSNSSLNVHMNLHTGEKPHICDVCHRGFGDPSNLKRHLRIHTRSRPYSCHLCPTSFNQSSHLVRHIRSHSQRGCQKSCRFCLATFPHYSNLRRHVEKCSEKKKRGSGFDGQAGRRGRLSVQQPQLYLNYDDQDVFYRVQENSIITSNLGPQQTLEPDDEHVATHTILMGNSPNDEVEGEALGEPYLELPNQETYMKLVSMRSKCCT